MTTANSTATKRNPIFKATVNPVNGVFTATGKNGKKYSKLEKAIVSLKKGDVERTVMVFEPARTELKGMLRKGKPVELRVVYDEGGCLRAIGKPLPPKSNDAEGAEQLDKAA